MSPQVARVFQESLNGCGGGRGFQWVLLEQLEAVASRQRDSSRGCGLCSGHTSGLHHRTFLLEKREKVSEVFLRIVFLELLDTKGEDERGAADRHHYQLSVIELWADIWVV